MKLSVIIPVYNEEKTLRKIISKVESVKGIDKEIVLVDDASSDKIREILESYEKKKGYKILYHDKNQGKGGALKTGFKASSGDYVVVQDADLEYNPNDYHLLLKELKEGEYNVVYGSRFMGDMRGMGSLALLANKFLTFLTNFLFGQSLTDMETCYKLIPRKIIEKVDIKSMRFNFEPEITAKILKMGYKIKEVPISYNARTHKEGKHITWKDGLHAVWTLIKFRFTD